MKKKFIYIFLNFLKLFILISFLSVLLFLIIQILDDMADFLRHQKEFVFKNYLYTLPLLFVQISPIITILSLMLILSEMVKNNELRVFFYSGIKMIYIFSIFLFCGFFSSIVSFSFKNFVSPYFISKIKNQKINFTISFSSPDYFFYSERKEGNEFLNVEFSEYFKNGEILTLKAEKGINYEGSEWVFKNGYLWLFDSKKNLIKKEKFQIKNIKIPLSSEILSISSIDIESFSCFQLYNIIRKLKDLKLYPVSLIAYFNEKISYPFLNFFIIFVTFPFLKKTTKISNIYVFSFSFLFSIFIYSTYILFFSLSKNAKISPFIGTWIIPIGILIYFLLSVKSLNKR